MKKFFLIIIIIINLYAFNFNIDNIIINNLDEKNIFNIKKFTQHLKNSLNLKNQMQKKIDNFHQKLDFTSRFAGIKATQNTINILNQIYFNNIIINKNLINSIQNEVAIFYFNKEMNFYLKKITNLLFFIIKAELLFNKSIIIYNKIFMIKLLKK